MPLGAHFKDASIWNPILERVEKKLAGWKWLYLSKGGRLTLLKSTLSSLPTYYLSLFTIPQHIANKLKRIQRNFLWGSSNEVFRYPLVAWDKVVWLVEIGGLAIRKVGLFNQALLGKWLWWFGKEATHLWRQVIATKYGEGSGGWCTRVVRGTHGCGLWKNIRKGANNFFGHVVYATGEGNRIRFWHDPWSGPIPLKELYPELFACAMVQEALIFDMVIFAPDGGGRSWNFLFRCNFNEWELRRFYSFYEHVSARIPSGEGEDILIWQLNRSGVFDMRSFYIALLKAPSVSFPWQSIWCVKVPKRVSFFLWTATRGGILTIDNLVKKNLPLVNWCCLCRCDEETVDHLLLHCKFASALWSEVLIMFGVQWVMLDIIVSLLFA